MQRLELLDVSTPGQVVALGMGAVALSHVIAALVLQSADGLPVLWTALASNILGMIAVPIAYITWRKAAIAPSLRVAPLPLSQGLWVLGVMIAALPAVLAIAEWNQGIHPPSPRHLEFVESLRAESAGDWVLSILSIVIVVPIAEELIFRGMIQQASRRVIGRWPALLFTAVVFSIWHGQLWNLAPLALVGFFFGLVYEATGSLLASVVAHAAYNLIVLLLHNFGVMIPDLESFGAISGLERFALTFAPLVALAVAWAAYGRLRSVRPWPDFETDDDSEL